MTKESKKLRLGMTNLRSNLSANEAGITLALVVAAGLVLTIGAMVLSARSFKNLAGSIRLGQSREARKIAESGMAKILDNLNKNYSYLLIENCEVVNNSPSQLLDSPECSGWQEAGSGVAVKGTFEQRGSVCSGVKLPASSIMSSLYALDSGYTATSDVIGKYRLIDYQFIGDSYQGGVATIKVQGQRISKDGGTPTITASAMIEKEVTIAPKCCDDAPYANLERCGASRKGSTTECDKYSDSERSGRKGQSEREKKSGSSDQGPDSQKYPDIDYQGPDNQTYSGGSYPGPDSQTYSGGSYQGSDSQTYSGGSYSGPGNQTYSGGSYSGPGNQTYSDNSNQETDNEKYSDSSNRGRDSEKDSDGDKQSGTNKDSDRESCEKEKQASIREFAAIGTNKWNLIQLKD